MFHIFWTARLLRGVIAISYLVISSVMNTRPETKWFYFVPPFPPSHYFHILSVICLTSDINWHSPRWFWGFIEKRLGGFLSRRKSWPTWLGKAVVKVALVPQQHAVLALYGRSLPMTSYSWLLHPNVRFLGEENLSVRGSSPWVGKLWSGAGLRDTHIIRHQRPFHRKESDCEWAAVLRSICNNCSYRLP